MRKETRAERAAWTDYFGVAVEETGRPNKYGARKAVFNGRLFDSQREAGIAAKLDALERGGKIRNLCYQVPFVLVEGMGKIRPIVYVADFTYEDPDGTRHVLDAKGFTKDRVYRLKKKLMGLMLGLEIEEV